MYVLGFKHEYQKSKPVSFGVEIIITRPDGSEIVVLCSAAPIRMPNGQIREAVLAGRER